MKSVIFNWLLFFLLLTFTACVETEIVSESFEPEVTLQPERINLTVGQTTILNATFTDENGIDRSNELQWRSTNTAVASVAANGIVTALIIGQTWITVTHGTLSDSTLVLIVSDSTQTTDTSSTQRMGTFQGNHSYSVKGTATLQQQGDQLKLMFGTDFVSSNGPQLGVYLAKNAPGVLTPSNSVRLGLLKKNAGTQAYEVPTNVQLSDYDYAVVYCEPFNVAFGFALLK